MHCNPEYHSSESEITVKGTEVRAVRQKKSMLDFTNNIQYIIKITWNFADNCCCLILLKRTAA
jgi:hypothetical protein